MMDSHDSVLEGFLSQRTLDLRTTKYRYMDQKCTPDIIYLVSECIENLPVQVKKNFTRNDIQTSEYFHNNLQFYFNKPDPSKPATANEIDKVIGQPLKTLAYAGILDEQKVGPRNYYSLKNSEALEFLTKNERNCFKFLVRLNLDVLDQSGQLVAFEKFRRGSWSEEEFVELKESFSRFFIANSNLGQRGSENGGTVEFRRIFPKIFNPLAVYWNMPGTVRGHVSSGPFVYQDLMYNRTNFRDVGKKKSIPRQEAMTNAILDRDRLRNYHQRENIKAKRRVLDHHNRQSEVHDSLGSGAATQAHHIFPVSKYPELQSIPENIIALTPSQHYQRAHPANNTQLIDREYQRTCLLAKFNSVRKDVLAGGSFYSREQFVWVLREGLGLDILGSESSFDQILIALRQYTTS